MGGLAPEMTPAGANGARAVPAKGPQGTAARHRRRATGVVGRVHVGIDPPALQPSPLTAAPPPHPCGGAPARRSPCSPSVVWSRRPRCGWAGAGYAHPGHETLPGDARRDRILRERQRTGLDDHARRLARRLRRRRRTADLRARPGPARSGRDRDADALARSLDESVRLTRRAVGGLRRGLRLCSRRSRLAVVEALTVAPVASFGFIRGAVWLPDNTIVFATNTHRGLLRVSADGGEPTPLTIPSDTRNEYDHLWPEILPDGRSLLFTVIPLRRTRRREDGGSTTWRIKRRQICCLEAPTRSTCPAATWRTSPAVRCGPFRSM